MRPPPALGRARRSCCAAFANPKEKAGPEVRFNGPLSLFAKYEFESVSESGSTIDVNSFLIGGKWNVGSMSLWQRETTGASLDPVGGILSFLH